MAVIWSVGARELEPRGEDDGMESTGCRPCQLRAQRKSLTVQKRLNRDFMETSSHGDFNEKTSTSQSNEFLRESDSGRL